MKNVRTLIAAFVACVSATACSSAPDPASSSDDSALGSDAKRAKKPSLAFSPSHPQVSPGRAVKLTVTAQNLPKDDELSIVTTDLSQDVWFEPGANTFLVPGEPVTVYLIARPAAAHGTGTGTIEGVAFESGLVNARLTYSVVGGDVGLTGLEADSDVAACHPLCATGSPIDDSCNACATKVVKADAYCKLSFWDDRCVSEAVSLCGGCN